MERRNFLASLGAAAALPAIKRLALAKALPDDLIRPRALRSGATVGLITPATYVADPDRLALAERTLNYFGLRMKVGKNVGRRSGYFGSTVDERLDDFHAMFRDPEV